MRGILIAITIIISACSSLSSPTSTPIATPTSIPTSTATETPSHTPTATRTATLTATASATNTPTITASPTITRTPSITPRPTLAFSFDNWDVIDLPDNIRDGIESPLLMFINSNDQQTIANIATAQPSTNLEILYVVSPNNPSNRISILELDSSTASQIYLAPGGQALAYFRDTGNSGLYILDMENGLSGRIIPADTLVQRGIFSEPQWSSDGAKLAVVLDTGYNLDIFLYERDGSSRANLTQHGAYDMWPSWSPDGEHIAFVSDRAVCPSWIPSDVNACDALTDAPPNGGHVYIMNIETGTVTQIADEWVTEAPYWVNAQLIAFAGGDQFDLLNPQRTIWLANIITGQVQQAKLADDTEDVNYLAESWSPDGSRVIFQRASASIQTTLMTIGGQVIDIADDLSFPRFGMSAVWSPDGSRIAIGGVDGQCPYGIRVREADFTSIARGNSPPSMCNPSFSADGEYIAFTGVNPRVDGRLDVYVANANGFGANNLTVNMRGQVDLIGWIGGTP